MPYDYKTERPGLFTERGQEIFIAIRDNANRLLSEAGAFRAQEAMRTTGSTWTMLAAFDLMVERGELQEVSPPGAWGQHRIFIDPNDQQ